MNMASVGNAASSESGTYCSAWGCNRRFSKQEGVTFHSFPLNDKERLKKWLAAMRRDDFTPTVHSRICAKHFLKSDYHPYSRYLIKTAVPSIFDFPKHLQQLHLYHEEKSYGM